MNRTDDTRERVLRHLERRESIAETTRQQLAERQAEPSLDPLGDVDPQVREQVEDAFYAERGRHRYRTSDGRVLFLTPEEIAQRRRARSQKSKRTRARASTYYTGQASQRQRLWLTWGFNLAAIGLALVVVWLILS